MSEETVTNKIRRFTKTDWYGWAGCERFKDGSEPFIYEHNLNNGETGVIILADATGVAIYIGEDEDLCWIVNKPLNPVRAEGYMLALAEVIKDYSYAPSLVYDLDHKVREEFKEFDPN